METGDVLLVVTDPSGRRRTIPLQEREFRIGRHADNHFVVRDSRASRHHARIVFDEGKYWIEDLKSTHGTWVNGERVERRVLRSGDRITLGFPDSHEFLFSTSRGELDRLLSHVPAASGTDQATQTLSKLRSVLEVARALQHSLSVDSVLDAVVDAALAVTGAERGFLLLRDDSGLSVRTARNESGLSIAPDALEVPVRLIGEALKNRRQMLTMTFSPDADDSVEPDTAVRRLNLRGALCVPLIRVRTGDFGATVHAPLSETLGVLYLDSRRRATDLSSGNRELLETLAVEASTILENARLLEEERARQKLEEELRLARRIQESLLPKQLPEQGWLRISASSTASRQVGGDYYDVLPLGPDRTAVVVADVSGKGVSSALLASLIQGAFLRGAQTVEEIQGMLTSMNRFLLGRTEGEKYATLFYCLCHSDGLMRWANAAHCAPLLVRRGGPIETLMPTGMPVGMFDTAEYEVQESRLEPGDKLVIYTDGITDARARDGRFFEEDRLQETVRRCAGATGAELHGAILQAVTDFTGGAEQADDVTLVVVEYRPEG